MNAAPWENREYLRGCDRVRRQEFDSYCDIPEAFMEGGNRYCYVKTHPYKPYAYRLARRLRTAGFNARVHRQGCGIGDYHVYSTPYTKRDPTDYGQTFFVPAGRVIEPNIENPKYTRIRIEKEWTFEDYRRWSPALHQKKIDDAIERRRRGDL